MTQEQKDEITRISKEFASGIDIPLNGSGTLIVDPLSGFLDAIGYKNVLGVIPKGDKHPQVLIIVFPDGSQLIPAGADFKAIYPDVENWTWLDKIQ